MIGLLLKNSITKRNKLLPNWIDNPSATNLQAYTTSRKRVCSMIREAKKEANYKKLGYRPSANTIYRTLKVLKSNQNTSPIVPDANLNEHFVSIGPLLSAKLRATNQLTKVPQRERSMVFQRNDEPGVMKVNKQIK